MVVIDSSAMVEALVGRSPAPDLLNALRGEIDAPHLLDTEVLSVLRGLTLGGKLALNLAEDGRHDYFDFVIVRYETAMLAERVWALRHQFTAYDATYLALAEVLGAPLFTCDAKLKSDAHGVKVRVFGRTA